jgi:hypothetical protein
MNLPKPPLSRRQFIKSTRTLASGVCLTGLSACTEVRAKWKKPALNGGPQAVAAPLAGNLPGGPPSKRQGFEVRATQETGWNVFLRKGDSTRPEDIGVNRRHLDHLHQAGVNWLLVFWTNAPQFDDAWAKASEHAHALGLRIGRAIYGFSGGGPETRMAEPRVPEHLLKPSRRGPKTALCPHDPQARQWVADSLVSRLQPNIDGILIEPAREGARDCICEQCRALRPFQWDALIINFIADRLLALKPDVQIMLHLNAVQATRATKQTMSADMGGLRKQVKHIFAWGIDDEASLVDWLDADPRFEAFTKLSRVILFPNGKAPDRSAEERVALVFRWCRLAADRGKTGYSFDWRLFGGREWEGREKDPPSTRIARKVPASIAVIGAAMKDPYLDAQGQRELLQMLRAEAEWDLDDPAIFYRSV